jgi:hypothetical protein
VKPATAPTSAVDGESHGCRQFFERFAARTALADADAAAQVHAALLAATLDVRPHPGAAQRRASISVDGTPIVYSVQLSPRAGAPAFRMLCEPGGLGITVDAQVAVARDVLRGLTARLGWHRAQAAAGQVLACVIPAEPGAMSDWWGGIWLGASLSAHETQLRVYANLRHGNYVARWQRVVNLLSPFADTRLETPLRHWIDTAGRVAIPVGVGMVLTAGGLAVVRVYLGVETPGVETLRIARDERFASGDGPIFDFCAKFVDTFGTFPRQSVTLGYDFALPDCEAVEPHIARFKADVSFGHVGAQRADAFTAAAIARALPAACADGYHEFRQDLEDCFGGSSIEYVSFASRGEELSELSVYARPHGCPSH